MTVPRDAGGVYVVGCKTLSALCVVALLTTLGACAGETATGGMATPTSTTPAAPAATAAAPAPAPAARTTAAAPKAAPSVLSPTEINEQCWMSSEVNKLKDLDAKARLVDKCVAEKAKAQGM